MAALSQFYRPTYIIGMSFYKRDRKREKNSRWFAVAAVDTASGRYTLGLESENHCF